MTWIAMVPTLLVLWPLASAISSQTTQSGTVFWVALVVLVLTASWLWTKYFQVLAQPDATPAWIEWFDGAFRHGRLHGLSIAMSVLVLLVTVIQGFLTSQLRSWPLLTGATLFYLFRGLATLSNPTGKPLSDYYLPPLAAGREAATNTVPRDFSWVFEPPGSSSLKRRIPLTMHVEVPKDEGGETRPATEVLSPEHQWFSCLRGSAQLAQAMAREFRLQTNVHGMSPFEEVLNCLTFCQTCFRPPARPEGAGANGEPNLASPEKVLLSGRGQPEEKALLAAGLLLQLDHSVALLEYPDSNIRTLAVLTSLSESAPEAEEESITATNRFIPYKGGLYAYVSFDPKGGPVHVGEVPPELSSERVQIVDLAE